MLRFRVRDVSAGRALLCALALAFAAAPTTRADYAVLRSGMRLHITGYVREGDKMRLTLVGGSVEVPATEVVRIEPEDRFTPLPPQPAAPSAMDPFSQIIHDAAQKHGLDEELIRSVIAAESNFNPRAVSPRQAMGLMQLLPETAARYAVKDIFDAAENVDAGTRYLKDLLGQYHGDLALALAAYNAGPDKVVQYGGVPPYTETRTYVRRVTVKYTREKQKKGNQEKQ